MAFSTLAWLSTSSHAGALTACTEPASTPMVINAITGGSGPSANANPGTQLGSPYNSPLTIGSIRGISCAVNMHEWVVPVGTLVSGVTFSSPYGALPVYSTGVPGIGIAMVAADNNQSFGSIPRVTYSVGPGTYFIGVKTIVYVVLTAPLNAGSYTIPAQNVAQICASTSGTTNTKDNCAYLSIGAVTVTSTYASCTIQPASVNQTVALPRVLVSNFSGVGSRPSTSAAFHIAINCPAKITLKATMTDANNPGNTGSTLTLTPGSSASGVGIQIYYNGSDTPLSLGPDSAAAGNRNQFLVGGGSSAPATNFTLPFEAKYVQTGLSIVPGSVGSLATITFSYQ
ncbi:fimbrial protein [Caballeronia terrestris]|nr:fimbrial protein [Caballeronia terrestris]